MQDDVQFVTFMHMLYVVCSKLPGSGVKGKYSGRQDRVSRFYKGNGQQTSPFWNDLKAAFEVLQEDFVRLDANDDKLVDQHEITMSIPVTVSNYERFDIASRLEHAFLQVDHQKSGTLDFYEYMFLAWHIAQKGAYHDLVRECSDSSLVKRCMMDIHQYYK